MAGGAASDRGLVEAILRQGDLMSQALAEVTKKGEGPGSSIKVSPQVKWPILDDTARDVREWREEFERICGLANDCRGLGSAEALVALGNSVKQHHAEVYKEVMKVAARAGEVRADPQKVYDEIMGRLLEFEETLLERQSRSEWKACAPKGKLTAHQFLPVS